MKHTAFSYVKLTLASMLVLLAGCACAWRLMKIQIVESDTYTAKRISTQKYTQTISATRGEIVDSSGKAIIENKVGYNVIIEPDTFPEDNAKGNQVLLSLTSILDENSVEWSTSLPISDTQPYTFTDDENAVSKLKENLKMNVYATADNCMDKLKSDYDIDDSYTPEQQRILAGIRYEMQLRGFSLSNRFTLAEDVPLNVVTELKERGVTLPGMDIVEEALRSVAQGDVVPHEIGTVGPIYAEEYEKLKSEGYALDDTVGKSGIERAMESTLRGTDGIKEITVENGVVVSSDMKTPVEAGKTVQLTVNSDYQRELQNILDGFINNFDSLRDSKTEQLGLKKISCGAIVVLDAKTAGVLGMVTAPTYNLEDYKVDYEAILNAENTPLVNRATDGLYRPGSTFKTITATAGLNEQIITGNSTYFCGHTYHFKDHDYNCTGSHGDIAVTQALRVSCNIFFYDMGRRMGIETINEYSYSLGMGHATGIEIPELAGQLSSPDTRAAIGEEWYDSYDLQSAIGQLDNQFTILQMASYTATLASRGQRMQVHLVDKIWDYNMQNVLYEAQPIVVETIEAEDGTWAAIREGMTRSCYNDAYGRGTSYGTWGGARGKTWSMYGVDIVVAGKTGSPQRGDGLVNSCFICYAPADDPEIAVAVIIEKGYEGDRAAPVAKAVLEDYFFGEDGAYHQNKLDYLARQAAARTEEP